MSILALTSDLLMQSQLSGAAARAGGAVEMVASVDVLLAKAEQVQPCLVILDLAHDGLDPAVLVPQLKQSAAGATILAFAPHVHRQRLAAAEQAGSDVVMSRGRFHAGMESLVRQYTSA
jgi:DNA-binding response OmpR family regulator